MQIQTYETCLHIIKLSISVVPTFSIRSVFLRTSIFGHFSAWHFIGIGPHCRINDKHFLSFRLTGFVAHIPSDRLLPKWLRNRYENDVTLKHLKGNASFS